MKIGLIPQNIFEQLAIWLKVVPTPLADTHGAFLKARTIMAAAKGQLFECLSDGPLLASDIAAISKTNPHATEKILNTLVHLNYLKKTGSYFSLSSLSRKWMLKDSPQSLYNKILFQSVEWDMVEQYDHYLRTGEPIDIHHSLNSQQWEMYQMAMQDLARITSLEIGNAAPVPKASTRLLDIGGAHGHYSHAFCERYLQLNAMVFDLPEALACSRTLSFSKNTDRRVQYLKGNIIHDAIGEEEWDIILMANLLHHFDASTNQMIANKVTKALRPGGFSIILDFVRDDGPREGDHIGALLDLYFSLTSCGGTFRVQEIIQWQKDAGLMPMKTIWLRTAPGHVLLVGVKKKV